MEICIISFRKFLHSLHTDKERIDACNRELHDVTIGSMTMTHTMRTGEHTSLTTGLNFHALQLPKDATLEERGKQFIIQQAKLQEYIQEVQALRDTYIARINQPNAETPKPTTKARMKALRKSTN